ncbi:MAG: adenine deaminase [Dehalococcoidales bacterium]|nr:adenine deaminase [Dehalococcoidales bacterium]
MSMSKVIRVAKGDLPADSVFTNARIVNVFTGEIQAGNVAIADGIIAGIGDYTEGGEIIDLDGKYLSPGLIDGHVHLESSMLDVPQYVRAVVPCGTTAIVTDLHEIANVAGYEGIRYVLKAARNLPLDIFLMAPSCVPATHLETSGADIDAESLDKILKIKQCIGLGEMMNYPGVIGGDDAVLAKIGLPRNRMTDGHAPGVRGKELNAYISTGIYSDHESVTLEEAKEKLEKGMYVMIREGSSEKNCEALLPIVTDKTYKRCMFVVDDRSCVDLLKDGDINAVVRKAIRLGLEPVRAIQLATINTAEYFGLKEIGGIAPGYKANLMVLDDLKTMKAQSVYFNGQKVGENGQPLFSARQKNAGKLTDSVNIKPFRKNALKLESRGTTFPVIEVVPGQIITRKSELAVKTKQGEIVPDIENDILKLVVVERHHATGNIGVGLVKGFGLKQGALASSVAHDSHNIVVVGTCDEDILAAVEELKKMGGGLAAVSGGTVTGRQALPVAGLLSEKSLEEVVNGLDTLEKTVAGMGVTLPSPFSVLSFLALPVIPELRLTDRGIVDVLEFRLI